MSSALAAALFESVAPPYGGNDEYTKLLLHFDGANGVTSILDTAAGAKIATANGNAQVSTAQSMFGGASALFDGTGDYFSFASHADFALPSSTDFAIECWVRFTSAAGTQVLAEVPSGGLQWYLSGGNSIQLARAAVGIDLTVSWTPSTGTWYHLAISRSGSSMRFFVNGAQVGSTATTNQSYAQGALAVGASGGGGNCVSGHMDEFRWSKGVARWTANFDAPSRPYT